MKDDIITLGHGSGAGLTRRLIRDLFDRHFHLPALDDAVRIENRAVTTTDAYVIKPLFFPGGDIGKLSVTGTVNDLCMTGAKPAYILSSFIIEEGFPIADLQKIVLSMQQTAQEAGVKIIAGDTKVVEKNKCDGLFITTTGIGFLPEGIELASAKIEPGDRILVNGTLGDHTVAIINARQKLGLDPAPESDCASLYGIMQILLNSGELKFARDATRGGVATILNEVFEDTQLGIIIDESSLPVRDSTQAVSGLLGLDPLYMANEGKLVAFLGEANEHLLQQLHSNSLGREASIIGEVTREVQGVYLRTEIGGLRPLLMLTSDPLPRIC